MLNALFIKLLDDYSLKPELKAPLIAMTGNIWKDIDKERDELEGAYKKQLAEVEKKIEGIEESYFVNKEMSRETYEKFSQRFGQQREEVARQLKELGRSISNPSETMEEAMELSLKLATVWASGSVGTKEKLQKLVFPEGIIYDKEKGAFRTPKVNAVFELMSSLTRVSDKKERQQKGSDSNLSPRVRVEGLEPPCLAAPDPKSGTSTNFATRALRRAKVS